MVDHTTAPCASKRIGRGQISVTAARRQAPQALADHPRPRASGPLVRAERARRGGTGGLAPEVSARDRVLHHAVAAHHHLHLGRPAPVTTDANLPAKVDGGAARRHLVRSPAEGLRGHGRGAERRASERRGKDEPMSSVLPPASKVCETWNNHGICTRERWPRPNHCVAL